MKDEKGIELVEGDLVMLTIDTPVEHPAELIIFLENKEYTFDVSGEDPLTGEYTERTETTNTVKYYPITEEGLQVAKYDNGTEQLGMHRQQEYTVDNIKPKHLLKVDDFTLRGYDKTIYDDIQDELA